ncbi:MAG TPA: glycosyltransferase [Actinobacteria bacterium]|nr:glycosyltransferase [Actinomycetota bacterium]
MITLEDYEQYIGPEAVERIVNKAAALPASTVAHVNSTYYGGGVSEMLDSLTLLMNSLDVKAEWRTIHGAPDFFSITKKMHNALQGKEINLSGRKKRIYERIIYENAVRNRLDHDFVVVHDPQPLALIRHYRKKGPWIWRCHVDMTRPNREIWDYIVPFVEAYDAVIFSIEEYRQKLKTPQVFYKPAIDPFSIKNRELSPEMITERLERYDIPVDLPLVVQISRFDRWKDPEGVIRAYRLARKEVDCTLVLLGEVATDDPEGEEVYQSLLDCRDERLIILSRADSALVNALQRTATVVVQKSLREGFGLTVSEAMWKGTPVIGSDVGGIPYQIRDGVNGFLVSSIEETAARIVQVIKDEGLRERLGEQARKTVRENFLMSRVVEEHIDLYRSFETVYRMRPAGC